MEEYIFLFLKKTPGAQNFVYKSKERNWYYSLQATTSFGLEISDSNRFGGAKKEQEKNLEDKIPFSSNVS